MPRDWHSDEVAPKALECHEKLRQFVYVKMLFSFKAEVAELLGRYSIGKNCFEQGSKYQRLSIDLRSDRPCMETTTNKSTMGLL